MKFLQKATLAAAIAVAPFAAQSLEALDDATLAATTGQAGVDIDITLTGANAVEVGSITYKDEGYVGIKGVTVGAASGSVTIEQTIDVNADGDLVMGTKAIADTLKIGINSVSLYDGAQTVAGIAGGTATANGSTLVSNVDLAVKLGATSTTIRAAGDANDPTGLTNADLIIDSTASVQLESSSLEALNGDVVVTGLEFFDTDSSGNKIAATIDQQIWANDDGLNMKLKSITGNLVVGGIELGGTSIGSLSVSNITLAGVTQTISGH